MKSESVQLKSVDPLRVTHDNSNVLQYTTGFEESG
jgi:hypothetical protein